MGHVYKRDLPTKTSFQSTLTHFVYTAQGITWLYLFLTPIKYIFWTSVELTAQFMQFRDYIERSLSQ